MLFTVTSLNYVARPPGPSDPNLDQNYDIFVSTTLAFNANVLHAPNRVRSEIRKDPSVTLFFGRTSLSNRNIALAILLLAGDVHHNQGWGQVQLTKYSSTPSTPNIYQVQVQVKYSFFIRRRVNFGWIK